MSQLLSGEGCCRQGLYGDTKGRGILSVPRPVFVLPYAGRLIHVFIFQNVDFSPPAVTIAAVKINRMFTGSVNMLFYKLLCIQNSGKNVVHFIAVICAFRPEIVDKVTVNGFRLSVYHGLFQVPPVRPVLPVSYRVFSENTDKCVDASVAPFFFCGSFKGFFAFIRKVLMGRLKKDVLSMPECFFA